jgi:hypothetical protein
MNLRGVARAVVESSITLAILALAGAAFVAWGALHPLPSDASLMGRFRAHHAEFDSLRTLVGGEAQVTDVVSGWTGIYVANRTYGVMRRAPDAGIGVGAQRWREHHRLMGVLGIRAAARGEGGRVSLWAGERGLVTGGVRKGYVWSAAPQAPVWGSLDDALEARAMVAYRPIGDGWWLVVVREDEDN